METPTGTTRVPISFSPINGVVMWPMLIRPSKCYLDIGPDEIEIRMAWTFRARVPRASVRNPRRRKNVWITAGAHGWRGRWLVNGSRKGLVEFDVDSPERARVMGLGVKLRAVAVSVHDPDGLIALLSA